MARRYVYVILWDSVWRMSRRGFRQLMRDVAKRDEGFNVEDYGGVLLGQTVPITDLDGETAAAVLEEVFGEKAPSR